jgi:hypothetical protein
MIQNVGPGNEGVAGVRVRQHRPYEVSVYTVTPGGSLALRQRTVESLPDPSVVYAVNYNGALVSSSKFKVNFNANGAVSGIRVETTRTLKESAEAAQSVSDQVRRLRQDERDEKDRERAKADEVARLKAIKDYRDAYKAATGLPVVPGEPPLLDGSSLPGK